MDDYDTSSADPQLFYCDYCDEEYMLYDYSTECPICQHDLEEI